MKFFSLLFFIFLLFGCKNHKVPFAEFIPLEENKLKIYTSHKPDIYIPIVTEFESRTGIWVDIVAGGTTDLLESISQNKENSVPDLIFGGGIESLEAYKDFFIPYKTSKINPTTTDYLSVGDNWTPFSSLPIVLIYNRKLVKSENITGWKDLLLPDYQGKIAFADPNVSGSSFTALVTAFKVLSQTYVNPLERFAIAIHGIVLPDSGEVVSGVASGKYLIGITLEETALKALANKTDIGIVYPKEGTSCVPDGCAIVKGAKHQENAQKFLDFIVAHDTQNFLQESLHRRTIRKDIKELSAYVPLKNIPLINYDVSWACNNRDDILAIWNDLVGKDTP
ncbi:MAG: extracellular solute-binding protein [Candidatus Treponema excrementipullorum]|nr:extracellular solute-binding protein [Spirochaetia bacterium]MCI7588687.1 extracellular solute-binding protein [Spirochaetia bacterium]MDY4465770.1 extracellular solute-binding protein [Candidatus Treponema excrementipullorum]